MAALQHMVGILWLQQQWEEEGRWSLNFLKIEFSFSWPRKNFPSWDVDSCGVAQFNLSGDRE